tara:strand:+ start:120 stop:461 length:342 start_codon:yes stop_codon:yes gene_type:complete
MKKYIVLFMIVPFFTFSQSNDKNTKDTLSVDGNCSMCKKRIEKATLSLKGVKYAKWNKKSNDLSIIYDNKKVNIQEIRTKIAQSGHDNGEYITTIEVYDKIPDCCKYREVEKH